MPFCWFFHEVAHFYLLILAASDRATLGFYFSLAVLVSGSDKFRFKHLRSYRSKSEFYDVFKQDVCPRLDFKRIFICLCWRKFDARKIRKSRVHYFSPVVQRFRKGWWYVYFSWRTIKIKQQMEFQNMKTVQEFKKVYMLRFFFA